MQEVSEGGEWPRMGKKMMGSRVSLCPGAETKTHPSAAARTPGPGPTLISPLHFSVRAHHPENEDDGEGEAKPLLRL